MITHDYRLIFIHIPKCAGRSISEIFNQRFDQFTANHYYREYRRFWDKYEKFAIVRNPYSRLVSIYHYIQQHRRHQFEQIANNKSNFRDWVVNNFSAFKGQFNLHSPEAERGKDWQLDSSHWFSPQSRFLYTNEGPGQYVHGIDKSIRIFKMEEGMEHVNDYLSSKGVKDVIPHLNKSKHDDWKKYYDAELIEWLQDTAFINIDCKELNYQF